MTRESCVAERAPHAGQPPPYVAVRLSAELQPCTTRCRGKQRYPTKMAWVNRKSPMGLNTTSPPRTDGEPRSSVPRSVPATAPGSADGEARRATCQMDSPECTEPGRGLRDPRRAPPRQPAGRARPPPRRPPPHQYELGRRTPTQRVVPGRPGEPRPTAGAAGPHRARRAPPGRQRAGRPGYGPHRRPSLTGAGRRAERPGPVGLGAGRSGGPEPAGHPGPNRRPAGSTRSPVARTSAPAPARRASRTGPRPPRDRNLTRHAGPEPPAPELAFPPIMPLGITMSHARSIERLWR